MTSAPRPTRAALSAAVLLAAALALTGCTADAGGEAETAVDSAGLPAPALESLTGPDVAPPSGREPDRSDEEYDDSPETPFQDVATSPLSTFSADVDTASYSNLRRQVNQGVAPEGVRIEERQRRTPSTRSR